MRTIGTFGAGRSLAWRGALPLVSCVVTLGLGSVGCSSNAPAPSPGSSTGGSTLGASGSPSGATAGSTASGGSAQPTAGASNGGSVSLGGGSGGDATSAGGTAGSAGALGSGGSSSSGAGGTGAAAAGSGGAAGSVAAANGCDGVTAKFCDDFEKQTSGQAPVGDFQVSASAGAMIVDGTKPRGGKQSLHIKMAKPGTRAMLDFKSTKLFPFNDLHGRAMMYITKIPTSDIHWDLVYSYSTNEWELGGQNGVFALVIDPPDHEVASKNKIPTGQWFCLQWEFNYAGAGADNSYSAKTDGVTIDKGAWTGADPSGMKWTAGPWKNLSVGWESYGGSDVDIEIWIDDLAFGEQVIPCPAP